MGRTIKNTAVGGLIFKPQADGSVIIENQGKTVATFDADGSLDADIQFDSSGPLSATTGTFTGALTGTTATMTGAVTAASLDAGSGDITTTGNISGQITGSNSYAEIFITGGSTTQTTNASGGTFDTITGFNADGANGDANDATADKANNKLIMTRAGIYVVAASFSFTGTNNEIYTVQGYNLTTTTVVNGAVMKRKIGTGTDVGSGSLIGIDSFAADDELVVRVAAVGISSDFTIEEGSLVAWRLGA